MSSEQYERNGGLQTNIRPDPNVNAALLAAQREAAQATHELALYKLQLNNAKREITRAHNILLNTEQQRDAAKDSAVRATDMARKLAEEKMVMIARDEGRKSGWESGVKRGRELAARQRMWDERERSVHQRQQSPAPMRVEEHQGDRPRSRIVRVGTTASPASTLYDMPPAGNAYNDTSRAMPAGRRRANSFTAPNAVPEQNRHRPSSSMGTSAQMLQVPPPVPYKDTPSYSAHHDRTHSAPMSERQREKQRAPPPESVSSSSSRQHRRRASEDNTSSQHARAQLAEINKPINIPAPAYASTMTALPHLPMPAPPIVHAAQTQTPIQAWNQPLPAQIPMPPLNRQQQVRPRKPSSPESLSSTTTGLSQMGLTSFPMVPPSITGSNGREINSNNNSNNRARDLGVIPEDRQESRVSSVPTSSTSRSSTATRRAAKLKALDMMAATMGSRLLDKNQRDSDRNASLGQAGPSGSHASNNDPVRAKAASVNEAVDEWRRKSTGPNATPVNGSPLIPAFRGPEVKRPPPLAIGLDTPTSRSHTQNQGAVPVVVVQSPPQSTDTSTSTSPPERTTPGGLSARWGTRNNLNRSLSSSSTVPGITIEPPSRSPSEGYQTDSSGTVDAFLSPNHQPSPLPSVNEVVPEEYALPLGFVETPTQSTTNLPPYNPNPFGFNSGFNPQASPVAVPHSLQQHNPRATPTTYEAAPTPDGFVYPLPPVGTISGKHVSIPTTRTTSSGSGSRRSSSSRDSRRSSTPTTLAESSRQPTIAARSRNPDAVISPAMFIRALAASVDSDDAGPNRNGRTGRDTIDSPAPTRFTNLNANDSTDLGFDPTTQFNTFANAGRSPAVETSTLPIARHSPSGAWLSRTNHNFAS